MSKVKRIKNVLQEYSLPLIIGVVAGLVVANWNEHVYHSLVHYMPFGGDPNGDHPINLHFLINDIFMVFFFGIAAKEITESVLPGGALNPPSKAVNPLLGTLGGVVGPVVFFFIFATFFMDINTSEQSVFSSILQSMTPGVKAVDMPEGTAVLRGWGIPTATDIALAWLVARLVFGNGHAAVGFLLLLAVADDAIGLGIIAIFYPTAPPAPQWLGLVALGMLIAYGLNKKKVQSWYPYIFIAGTISWFGLFNAHLHPALALVPIVPFLPGPEHDLGLYAEEAHEDEHGNEVEHHHHDHSPLENFEHSLKGFVDFGLFFFAFANAGVKLDTIGPITTVIFLALLVGKTVGIAAFSFLGTKIGFPLPDGMKFKHLVVAGVVAGLGLTVALFVTGQAYPTGNVLEFQGPAKMGAVFSAGIGVVAIYLGKMLKVHERYQNKPSQIEMPNQAEEV